MTRVLGSRYELGRLLGVGGMAEIFEANDTRLARRVAVKLLRTDLPDPRALERFEREARIAARFNHPNAVTIFDVGDDGSRPFIVMELIEGRSLAELLRDRGPLAPTTAIAIVSDVLLALSAAHSGGIIHRDVKPANILLGDDGRVKLADFGIAKAMSDASAGLTAIGQVIGTPRYLAPEQMRGAASTPRSDQYSAGIVLYEMLTGHLPMADDPVATVAAGSATASPLRSFPSLVSRRPDAPAWLGDVIDRAVAADPAERFDDVAAMRAALHRRGSGAVASPAPHRSAPAARTQILDAAALPRLPMAPSPASPSVRAGTSERPGSSAAGIIWAVTVASLLVIIAAGAAVIVWSRSGDDATASTPITSVTSPASTSVATTRALSTTIASTVVVPVTTVAATTVPTTVSPATTVAATTTSDPTSTTVALEVDIADVIDQLAEDPFSYGSRGEQLLENLRYVVDLSQEPGAGQLRRAIASVRGEIAEWVADGSLDADIGEQADRSLLTLRR